jgi:hypothetical protein
MVKRDMGIKRKKIIITPKLVFDTITTKKAELTVDSLVLSRDYTSERIEQTSKSVLHV